MSGSRENRRGGRLKDDGLSALDRAILDALRGRREVTYVIRNIVSSPRQMKVAMVRRRLERLERAGLVERTHSIYARQICWRLAVAAPGGEVAA